MYKETVLFAMLSLLGMAAILYGFVVGWQVLLKIPQIVPQIIFGVLYGIGVVLGCFGLLVLAVILFAVLTN